MSDKSFLSGRLGDEFVKFTTAIFGADVELPNTNVKFEDGISGAIVDYTDLRLKPIQDQLANHEQRIAQLEQLIVQLAAGISSTGTS